MADIFPRSRNSSKVLAIESQVADVDPDKLDRVRAKFLWLLDLDSDYFHILRAFAEGPIDYEPEDEAHKAHLKHWMELRKKATSQHFAIISSVLDEHLENQADKLASHTEDTEQSQAGSMPATQKAVVPQQAQRNVIDLPNTNQSYGDKEFADDEQDIDSILALLTNEC